MARLNDNYQEMLNANSRFLTHRRVVFWGMSSQTFFFLMIAAAGIGLASFLIVWVALSFLWGLLAFLLGTLGGWTYCFFKFKHITRGKPAGAFVRWFYTKFFWGLFNVDHITTEQCIWETRVHLPMTESKGTSIFKRKKREAQ